MMMPGQNRSVWLQHQCETVVAETFRKGAVDGDSFSAPLQRRLPLIHFHRNVSIHDQTLIGFDPEFAKNFVAEPGLMDKTEIRIFRLLMRTFLVDQIALKGSDTILSKERRFGATPEVPEYVEISARFSVDDPIDDILDRFEECDPGVRPSVDHHRQKLTPLVNRNAPMEDQVLFPPQIHRPERDHPAHVAPELLTGQK